MLASNVERLGASPPWVPYRDTEYSWQPDSQGRFDLALADGAWTRTDMLPPGCRIANAQDGSTYHSCLFRMRRSGLELSFSLNGENVAFADEFADFVRAKLEGWRVRGGE